MQPPKIQNFIVVKKDLEELFLYNNQPVGEFSIQREGGTVSGSVGINQGINDDLGTGIGGRLLAFHNLKYLPKLYLGVNSISGSIPYNLLGEIENKAFLLDPLDFQSIEWQAPWLNDSLDSIRLARDS